MLDLSVSSHLRFAHIDVAFCVGCNYQPRAVALADTLRRAYPDSVVTLTPTGGGAFEVSADGRLVFSKNELGRHAQPGEVISALQTLGAATNTHPSSVIRHK
jgi:selenoprotein W-related protein